MNIDEMNIQRLDSCWFNLKVRRQFIKSTDEEEKEAEEQKEEDEEARSRLIA